MNELSGKHIVLGLTGGIACYKAAELCRALVKEGASVQVVMTEAAGHFITAVTMQALSNRPVYGSQWDSRKPNNMAHINLGREADAILGAPDSADFFLKLLLPRDQRLLSLMCLARPVAAVPLIVTPAMNREMWANPATQRNVAQLRADGIHVLDVGQGEQACGETGDGRMLEADEILADLIAFFTPKVLAGQRLLVTAAVYDTRVDNEVVQDPTDLQYYQTGSKRVRGVELSAVGSITQAWSVSAGFTTMDTKVLKGPAVTRDGTAVLTYTPDKAFTAWTSYMFPFGLSIGGGARYSGEMKRGTDGAIGTPTFVEDYWVFDAVASYAINESLTLRLNANNVSDETYVAGINKSGYRYSPGAPRNYLLTATFRF